MSRVYHKGEKALNWKGGRYMKSGYWVVRCEGHPRAEKRGHYVKEQVLIMEKALGRYLRDGEIVHHLNGNKSDNRIENLTIVSSQEHARIHHTGKQYMKGRKLVDDSDRLCFKCGKKSRAKWHRIPKFTGEWYCHSCYSLDWYHKKRIL